jgi:hypothetical protein
MTIAPRGDGAHLIHSLDLAPVTGSERPLKAYHTN